MTATEVLEEPTKGSIAKNYLELGPTIIAIEWKMLLGSVAKVLRAENHGSR